MRVGCSLWNVAGSSAGEHARRLVDAGVDLFHWDRADGIFAPAGGFTAEEAAQISLETGTRAEAHLMLADPLSEVDQWCEFCDLIAVPVEVSTHVDAIRRIEKLGRQAAVVISPSTALANLSHVSGLATLVMSITPGMAGSSCHPDTFPRLTALSDRPLLGVDGGITADLLPKLKRAGAGWIAVGTALVNSGDPGAWLRIAEAIEPESSC